MKTRLFKIRFFPFSVGFRTDRRNESCDLNRGLPFFYNATSLFFSELLCSIDVL